MKMKLKKYGKLSSIFKFSISKLDYMELFIKFSEKSFFSKFLPAKGHTRTEVSKGLMKHVLENLVTLRSNIKFP